MKGDYPVFDPSKASAAIAQAGISISDLITELNVTARTFASWFAPKGERHEPRPSTLTLMAILLNVDEDGLTSIPQPEPRRRKRTA